MAKRLIETGEIAVGGNVDARGLGSRAILALLSLPPNTFRIEISEHGDLNVVVLEQGIEERLRLFKKQFLDALPTCECRSSRQRWIILRRLVGEAHAGRTVECENDASELPVDGDFSNHRSGKSQHDEEDREAAKHGGDADQPASLHPHLAEVEPNHQRRQQHRSHENTPGRKLSGEVKARLSG